jgi:hypothetical protein
VVPSDDTVKVISVDVVPAVIIAVAGEVVMPVGATQFKDRFVDPSGEAPSEIILILYVTPEELP